MKQYCSRMDAIFLNDFFSLFADFALFVTTEDVFISRKSPFLQQLTLLQAITIKIVRKITPFIKFTIGDQQDHFLCPLTLITSHISIIFPILLINRYRKNCLHNYYINLFIINFCYIRSYPKLMVIKYCLD